MPPIYDECTPALVERNELFCVVDALVEAAYRLLLCSHLPQAIHGSGSIGLARQLTLERVVLLEQGLRLQCGLFCGGLQLAIVLAQRDPLSKLLAHRSGADRGA